MKNPYLQLSAELNEGRLRAVLSSGQAVVLYRLAVMSKDGDWILREDSETVQHVLQVLADRKSHYRFGAPMDLRWLSQGWSSHFEHQEMGLRLRTDFITRPPRISASDLERIWENAAESQPPVVGLEQLADIKKTNREKDYAVIGELARLMPDPRSRFLYSRSARDLLRFAQAEPELLAEMIPCRGALSKIEEGRRALERALDEERRSLMHTNEERLAKYRRATRQWVAQWPAVRQQIEKLPLLQAHKVVVANAEGVLPFKVGEKD